MRALSDMSASKTGTGIVTCCYVDSALKLSHDLQGRGLALNAHFLFQPFHQKASCVRLSIAPYA